MALIALLLSYGGLMRGRYLETGIWLGVAALSHVAVAVHGVVAVTAGVIVSRPPREWLRTLAVVGGVCAVVASPVLVAVVATLLTPNATAAAANADALALLPDLNHIQDLWRRRLIHEFSWNVGLLPRVALLLSDAARATILWTLIDGSTRAASELAFAANISAQSASRHLALLVKGGLLEARPRGRQAS